MARIPETELERLKASVSVERLAEARGVRLKRQGENLLGPCPFHDDREPSLVITPSKNLWHCLGACRAGGSVIDWVMRAEGVSFRHAVELLRSDLPPQGASAARPVQRSTRQKLSGLMEKDAEDDALLLRVVEYYHQALKESPEALEYLAGRGLNSSEMIDRFRLGFANRTLGYRLPAKNRAEGAELRGRLQRLGILRGSGHEHMNGSVVVPILDEEGQLVEMYGRKVGRNLRPGTPMHLYLPGPHRGVFNVEALQASREVILCEALLDALTFWCAGLRHVTSSYGVEGFTPDHWTAMKRHGTQRVLIAYDRDEAGERAAEKLAGEMIAAGIGCYRVLFPKGMDANAYALKVQPAARSLELLVRNARWLGKGQGPAVTVPELPSAPQPEVVVEAAVAYCAGSAIEPAPSPAAAEIAASDDVARDEESDAPLVSPEPATAPAPAPIEQRGEDEVILRLGERRWRVRGLSKNLSHECLKVNLLVSRENAGDAGEAAFHVDTLDLYSARHRAQYLKAACEELRVEERLLKRDLGHVLLRLEELQDERIKKALEPQAPHARMEEGEREEAMTLLRDPRLMERILEDFERCGVVGEHANKLVGYLAAVSRKLEAPLAVLIQSSSAAGKSSLMEAVLAFLPEEERVQYSAMTGQALFYVGETDLAHKVLAIAEEEGAERASYALKLLQSEGRLTIASTGKDPSTGRLVTQEYRVEGPVMIFLTTTAIEIDEELLNRCLVLSVDEGREQTRAIHRLQRERQTLQGQLLRQDRERILKVHRNAQRLLQPLLVVNPHASELSFLDHATRTRRDHVKYLTLIRAIALLHQHQREVKVVEHGGRKVRYVEVTRDDVATANRLARDVLGRSLDELPPQTRRLLGLVRDLVKERGKEQGRERGDVRFTRRELRERTGWGDTQLKVHLARLVELERVLVHVVGRRFLYELLDGLGDDGPQLPGLIDVEALDGHEYDGSRSGPQAPRSGSGRPSVGGWSGCGRGGELRESPEETAPSCESKPSAPESRAAGALGPASRRTPLLPLAAGSR